MHQRGERRAFYACGAVFALVAESASGTSFFRFARQLVDANRADGVISRAEWLAALTRVSRRPDLARDIARLLDRGVDDSGEFITDLLVRAGVQLEVDPDGDPTPALTLRKRPTKKCVPVPPPFRLALARSRQSCIATLTRQNTSAFTAMWCSS